MKGKSGAFIKTSLFSFLIAFVLVLSFPTHMNEVLSSETSLEDPIRFQAGSFILIESDANFSDYLFPGEGNSTHPYLIENYIITGDFQYGIYIWNTTKHFIIRNCTISVGNGIFIDYTANKTVTIYNNTISSIYSGIRVFNSNECNISSNICVDTGIYGIELNGCYNSTIDNNVCSYASEYNLLVLSSPQSNVTNNYCSNAVSYGMFFQFALNSSIINNTLQNDGLQIEEAHLDYQTYTVFNNSVNDKKLGFFVNEENLEITTPIYDQLYIIDCNEVLITNQEFLSTDTALFVLNCTSVDIRENFWSSNDQALRIEVCSYVNFIDNVLVLNEFIGSFSVLDLFIIDNYIGFNNMEGVRLKSCYEVMILNNTITNNEFGIRIQSSRSLHIQNNFISNNARYGIEFHLSELSNIVNNTISYNFGAGIDLDNTHDCLITYNYFIENIYYGVAIHSASTMNIVHHNAFINNNPLESSQALDSAVMNTWYDEATEKGNYWSDWDGNFAYSIDGVVNSADLYPLDEPPVYGEEDTADPEEPPPDDEPKKYTYYAFFSLIPFYGTIYALIFRQRRLNQNRML
jgi:parallel beta-helix repeat protein